MQRYLSSAWRLRFLVVVLLAIVWVPGLYAAYLAYASTFESAATVWVEHTSGQYTFSSANDPNLGVRAAPAAEQAEIFNQLLQTNTFLTEVISQTSVRAQMDAARDKERFFVDIRRRFRAQALGTNLVRVSYRANEPGTAAEMVSAALAAREKRVKASRGAATSATITFYQTEYEIAQKQAIAAQRALESFNADHTGKLSAADEFQQGQLRLAVEISQGRLNDLRQQIEKGTVSTALLDMAESLSFQVIDQPVADPFPSGGTRDASFVAGVAFAGGLLLAVCLIVLVTLLSDRVESAAELTELTGIAVFGSVPRHRGRSRSKLRAALAAAAFDSPPTGASTEPRVA